jgi:anti-sigma factor RsiW
MTSHPYHDCDLEAYLDEGLAPEEMARIEQALRSDPALVRQLASIHARRDAGVHSLGAIWRRHRLTCFTREQLGSYLLGTLDDETAKAVRFHIETVACRYCAANLADLKEQQIERREVTQARRSRYFQSSAGHLPS